MALVFSGAGQLPGVLPFLVLVLLAALMVSRAGNSPGRRFRWLFILTLSIPFLCLLTLIPLPDGVAGARRARHFQRARTFCSALADVGVDTLAGDGWTLADASLVRRAIQAVTGSGQLEFEASGGSTEGDRNRVAEATWQPRARPVPARLTLNRAGTVRTLIMICGAWACFWYVGQSTTEQKRRLLLILLLGGTAVAVAGILGRLLFPQGKTSLWLLSVEHGRPMGPFVNRNHFALFCAMLIPVAVSFAAGGVGRSRGGRGLLFGARCSFSRLLALSCTCILAAGVVVSLSRSGVLVLGSAGLVITALLLRQRWFSGFVAVALVVALVAGMRYLPMDEFHDRIETLRDPLETESAQTRLQVWGDSLRIWRDFPVAGCGTDAFRVVYPMYKSSTARKGAIHAENEYVQILADNGLLGALMAVCLGVALFRGTLWGNGNDESGQRRALRDIALSVVIAVAVHAFFDFGVRMPLNCFMFATILGCALPLSEHGDASGNSKAKGMFPGPRIAAALLFVILAPIVNVHWLAAWNLDRFRVLAHCEVPTLTRSLAWAPTYWHTWNETGRRALTISRAMVQNGDERAGAMADLGIHSVWIAAFLNASDFRVWMAAAQVSHETGDLEAADAAARRVISLKPYRKKQVAEYLLDD